MTTITPDDIAAAQRCRSWLDTLAVIADPPQCDRCRGSGKRIKLKQFEVLGDCPICLGTGRLPVPDLVSFCCVFGDWLEEQGDPRAELVRGVAQPGGIWLPAIGDASGKVWISSANKYPLAAKRLRLLFEERCERCRGQGEISDDDGWGVYDKCQDCAGTGWLDLPVPVLTRGEPVAVPEEVAVCKRSGCGGSLVIYSNLSAWDQVTGFVVKEAMCIDCSSVPEHRWRQSEWQSEWQSVRDAAWAWVRRRVRRIGN